MMNLLISIVGDTFERVQTDAVLKDAKSTIELLTEVDTMFFWNRAKTKRQYIFGAFAFQEEGGN